MGKKVLVFGMSNRLGGTEAAIECLARGLKENGLEFDYVSEEMLGGDTAATRGSKCYVVPAKRKHYFKYKKLLKQLFTKHASDYFCVWVNLNSLSNIDAVKYAKRYGIRKRIIHVHSTCFLANPIQQLLSRYNKLRVGKVASDFVACSNEAGEFFFGQQEYSVINNAVEKNEYIYNNNARKMIRDRYGIGDEEHVIGTVGRLHFLKNQSFLLEVLARMEQEGKRSKLLVVGEGEMAQKLQERCAQLGLSDDVIFAGGQDNVADYLSAMDVFAFPSLFEGLGLALVEAQMNGLPCVASDSVPLASRASDSIQYVSLGNIDAWTQSLWSLTRADFVKNDGLLECFDPTYVCSEFLSLLKKESA